MEVGAHVWLRSESSRWGWVPAKITNKEDAKVGNVSVINLTITNDTDFSSTDGFSPSKNSPQNNAWRNSYTASGYFGDQADFETIITVDPEQLKTADHEEVKLRNLPRSYMMSQDGSGSSSSSNSNNNNNNNNNSSSPNSISSEESVVGGVHDLIGLTHLHEPAILHALRLRYDADIIYTSTGPILIAINPFKDMPLYNETVMERYRLQGEEATNGGSSMTIQNTPFKRRTNDALIKKLNRQANKKRLPPHAYQTADDAYRAMMRGLENNLLMNGGRGNSNSRGRGSSGHGSGLMDHDSMPTNQSILVSGESGAGKTVTTKIVLNYLAMLSKKASVNAHASSLDSSFRSSPEKHQQNLQLSTSDSSFDEDGNIESHVLQSNPILESFGNARTIRNDNSSRFGKYIDIRFTPSGKLTGASIETYLLEKVRLIHPSTNERNYHVFYQFLCSASDKEREDFFLEDFTVEDFRLLSQTGTYDRRDGVSDESNHVLMLEAMVRFMSLFLRAINTIFDDFMCLLFLISFF
jgi:myosin heavy subunit